MFGDTIGLGNLGAAVIPPISDNLAVHLNAKDATSTANFSSGTNAANTQWVDLSGNSRNGTFAVYSGSNAFSWDATNKVITTNSTTKLSHTMPSKHQVQMLICNGLVILEEQIIIIQMLM